MPKLTDAAIKATRCANGQKRVELSDTACPGLILRVTRAGSKSFLLKYWSPVLSKTVGLTLGSYPALDLAAARRKVGEHRKLIADGEDPRREKRAERKQIARQEELSFDGLADRYIAEYVLGGEDGAAAVRLFNETGKWPRIVKPNKRSWKNDVGYLKRPREEWGNLTAASITDDDVAEVLDIIAENAPVSANRTQSILHTLFNWARQPGRKYVPSNPVAGLHQRGGKEKKRDRVLSDDEIRTLWWGLDHPRCPSERPIRLAMKLILTTMVRPYQSAYAEVGELSGLGTAEGLYELPPNRVKRFRPVLVPLSDLAQEIVAEAIADEDQVVLFPSKFSDGDVSIRRDSIAQALNGKKNDKRRNGKIENRIGIREFLEMEHFTAHDLRRTSATLARRAGAPRPDVKAMLDHINGDVTAIYDVYDMLPEKRNVVATLAAELRRVIGNGPTN